MNLPDSFLERIYEGGLSDLATALEFIPPVSLRVNPYKKATLDFNLSPIPWCDDGFYVNGDRPKFTLDPLIHSGSYYVQEASSMIVGEIARSYQPKIVLDLCAAPGGKTTHLASVVGLDGCVVANEVIRSRAGILSENIQKCGLGNVIVTSSDASNFGGLNGLFDLAVIDVPCSGEGMFRKDIQSRGEWSLENVNLCAARGKRIVSDAWNAIKDGGIVIYSTCTFNRFENQDNVRWICENLGASVEKFNFPKGATESDYGVNFYPHLINGEGFFVAVLRKDSSIEHKNTKVGRPLQKVNKSDIEQLRSWTNGELEYRVGGETIYGYNALTAAIIETIIPLGVIYSGVGMGSIIRGELKPNHSLALYCRVKTENINELPLDEALKFLSRQNLDPTLYNDGLGLVTYKNIGLGWSKGLGRRVNNLYPQNWRILNL